MTAGRKLYDVTKFRKNKKDIEWTLQMETEAFGWRVIKKQIQFVIFFKKTVFQ